MTPHVRDDRVRDAYKAKAGDRCEVCRWRPPVSLRNVAGGKIDQLLAAHHIHPVACGGPDTKENMVQLCLNCHGIAHHMGRMVPGGLEALRGANTLRTLTDALEKGKDGPKEWIGPKTRKDFFFAMVMLSNRREYVRFEAMWLNRFVYLGRLEDEAYEQDEVETIRLTRAFTISGATRDVYGRRRA